MTEKGGIKQPSAVGGREKKHILTDIYLYIKKYITQYTYYNQENIQSNNNINNQITHRAKL